MPNLPKPRLRRTARRGDLVSAPAQAEPQRPNVEQIDSSGLRWVNIEHPGTLERTWLEDNFDFHALDLEDVLSRNQRPKIDVYDDYLFIVLHFPVFDPAAGRLGTGELDLFVGPGYLVTIPNQPLQPVEYLFERCRVKEELREQLFSRGSGYLLYRLVDDSFDYCFPMLRKIGNKLDALEDDIFEGRSDEVVRDISNVKQEIINFRKVIRPQRPVLRDLEKVKQRYLATSELDLEIYFDDIVDAHERIWDMLENYKEVIGALAETNESVISHRRQRHPPGPHLDQRHRPAAHPAGEHLGNECRRARRGKHGRFLDRRRRDGRPARRDGRLLPQSRLAVACPLRG